MTTSINDLHITEFSPDDYSNLASLLTAISTEEVHPDRLRAEDSRLPKQNRVSTNGDGQLVGYARRHLLIWHESNLVGQAVFWRAPWTRPGSIASHVDILPSQPGAEHAAQRLLIDQHAWAKSLGASEVMGVIDDGSEGRRATFLALGYEEEAHIVEASLTNLGERSKIWTSQFSHLQPNTFPDLEFLCYADLPPGERRIADQQLHSLYTRTLPDNPGHVDATPAFDQWRAETVGSEDARPDWIFLARTKKSIVGLTFVLPGDEAATAYVDYTAVDRNWRGKGIATALKLQAGSILAAQGTKTLLTEWETSNGPIGRANTSLGFKVGGGHRRMVLPLAGSAEGSKPSYAH